MTPNNNTIIAPPGPEAPGYDFDYICRCLSMIPLGEPRNAINLATVIYIECADRYLGTLIFHMPDNVKITVTELDMTELEKTLKAREAEVARLRAAQIEREARHQIDSQMRAANEAIATADMQNKLNRRRPT